MNEMDEILKDALSPTEYPSDQLNEKIMNRMKENGKMKRKNRTLAIAAVAILLLLIIPTSAIAAYRYLHPKEVAETLKDEKLGEAFEQNGEEGIKTVIDGSYEVNYLGKVSGESISERTGSAFDLHPERTYIAIAIKRADGADITNAENFFVSPLIQGLKPWKYNIATMHGSYMEKIIDGVLYRITECDNIEIFADRKLYLAISDTTFFNENAFLYDEATGLLSENTVYEGTNVLFPIQLDASKADSKKAKEYLEQFDKEWDSEEDSSKESTMVKKSSKNLRIQQETFVDKENGITFHLPKYDSDYEKWGGQSWSANEEYSDAVFRYRFQVEGEGIDTLTYTLNQGKLGDFPRNEYDDWKVYDNPYTISYEEQENIDDIYNLQFIGKFADYGYDKDYVAELGVTDIEERIKIEYEVLNKAIASTTLNLDIKMKDGRTITKILTFKNVLSNDGKHSVWIQVDVKD